MKYVSRSLREWVGFCIDMRHHFGMRTPCSQPIWLTSILNSHYLCTFSDAFFQFDNSFQLIYRHFWHLNYVPSSKWQLLSDCDVIFQHPHAWHNALKMPRVSWLFNKWKKKSARVWPLLWGKAVKCIQLVNTLSKVMILQGLCLLSPQFKSN